MTERNALEIIRNREKVIVKSAEDAYLLTPWCRVLLEKLTGLHLVKKFPAFHGTRRFNTALTSVRHLSVSWTNPIQSIYPHPTSWRSLLMLSTHVRLGLPSSLFPSGFPTKTLYTPLSSPIRATCPAHLILLAYITSIILGEEYKSFSPSLCNLLHSPVTSSLLGPNILLNTMFSTTLSFVVQKTLRRIIIAAMKWTLLTAVFIGKDKTKGGMVNKLCTYSTQVAKYLTELPGVIGQARKATSPFEAWKYLITDEILDKIVEQTLVYSYRTYCHPRK